MFSKKPAKSLPKVVVPTLDEALPALGPERELLARVQEASRNHRDETESFRQSVRGGEASEGRNERVAAILAGVNAPSPPSEPMVRLGEMVRRQRDLDSAVEVQRAKIAKLEAQASIKVCDHVRQDYTGMVVSLCDKIIEAHELNAHLVGMMDEIHRQRASTSSLPQFFAHNLLGHPRDKCSAVAFLLREAKDNGFIDKVPETLSYK